MTLFSILFLTVISFFYIFFSEVDSVSEYDLFPPTTQFFEDKFWDSHSPSSKYYAADTFLFIFG